MSERAHTVLRIVWTGLFAVVFTAAMSAIWTVLLVANLATTPAIPWAVAPMALVLWAAWTFLDGRWGWPSSQDARRRLLRSRRLPMPVMLLAIAVGLLWMVALAGFWIVVHRLVAVQSNPLPDLSRYPPFTVVAVLSAAAITGAVAEEAGFRGYFLSALRGAKLGPAAVLAAALLMAPEHALTQGFVWPTLVFYLLFDVMQGAIAYVTGSVRPGVVTHAIGLFVFFDLIWPHDAARTLISAHGPDAWFWLHVVQIVACGGLSLAAFAYLARLVRTDPQGLQAAPTG